MSIVSRRIVARLAGCAAALVAAALPVQGETASKAPPAGTHTAQPGTGAAAVAGQHFAPLLTSRTPSDAHLSPDMLHRWYP